MRSSTSATLSASRSSSRADWSRAIAWPFFFVILGGFTQKIHAVAPRFSAPRRSAGSPRLVTPRQGTPPGHAERLLDVPQLVVGADNELWGVPTILDSDS